MSANLLVHICQKSEWKVAQAVGSYRASGMAVDGFIHCSRPEQVLTVANRYYAGVAGLVLLWIDQQDLASEVRWEGADGEIFPHIYGPVNLSAVISVVDFQPDTDGVFRKLPRPEV
jgi:uncharacterized protein (DUF952 family)